MVQQFALPGRSSPGISPCIPEATGRVASSSRIADAIAFVHIQASAGSATLPMQLHSLPSSQYAIAGQSLSSRTIRRTNRTCHLIETLSARGLSFSSAGGTNSVPLIQPVTIATTSCRPFSPAISARVRNRSTMRSSTPSDCPSSIRPLQDRPRTMPHQPALASMGWKSRQFGNTRTSRHPVPASCRKSSRTTPSSHNSHMRVPACEAQ